MAAFAPSASTTGWASRCSPAPYSPTRCAEHRARAYRGAASSGVQAALLAGREDALAGHREGRGAQADLVAIGRVPDLLQRVDHDLVEPHVDLVLAPEERR